MHSHSNLFSDISLTPTRPFKLLSQVINVTDIDFKKRTICLNTILNFLPQNPPNPTILHLNCQQMSILKLLVNNEEAKFSYIDPCLEICYNNKNRRDVKYFFQSNRENVLSSDLDLLGGVGELVISIPQTKLHSSDILKILIECKLDRPKGGIQFIIPQNNLLSWDHFTTLPPGTHLYTSTRGNSSRLWFPCVDSYSELCTWEINICCPSCCFAISSGDLIDHKYMIETKRKLFKYQLRTPTSAPNIGLAVGTFEVFPDPTNQQFSYFHLPEIFPLVGHTLSFLKRVYEYLQDLLNFSLPYKMYKIVFVCDCTSDFTSYSSLTICAVDFLHPREMIDQAIDTRKMLISAISSQYFGNFLCPYSWNDYWIVYGLQGYASGLIFKSVFGTNEYNFLIKEKIDAVFEFYSQPDVENFPLHFSKDQSATFSSSCPVKPWSNLLSCGDTFFHPLLSTSAELFAFHNKASLVLRMLSLRIGRDVLLKVIQKILAISSQASKSEEHSDWATMLISTYGFVRLILTVSGKDISSFMHNWVCTFTIPSLYIHYTFNRRKNSVELEVKQDSNSSMKSKFTGPLVIVVQEIDNFYLQTIHIEDMITHHEIQFHSKLKRSKRKQKCILFNGLEIEFDMTTCELEYPLLWVKPDPQMCWLSRISIDQPTQMWMNLLKHERDVISQRVAISALTKGNVKEVISLLVELLLDTNIFYRVRILCIQCLIQLLNKNYFDENSSNMIDCFYKLYGSKDFQNIVAPNDFNNFGFYFLQKEMPKAIAGLRNQQQQTPKDVLNFLIDLINYNQNTFNDYSDDYYLASLVQAISYSLTMPLNYLSSNPTFNTPNLSALSDEIFEIVRIIVHLLNIEKLLPSHKYVITCSCVVTIKKLYLFGFIPLNLDFLYTYVHGQFSHVQFVAIKAILEILSSMQDDKLFHDFFHFISNHDLISFRSKAIEILSKTPPFIKKKPSHLNKPALVEQLWVYMNYSTVFNPQIRMQLASLYLTMYGRVTPACLPQSLGVVIDLKEKTAHSSLHLD